MSAVVDVRRRVTDLDLGAERAQCGHGDRVARLAAADRDAALEQDAGQRAHPGPGDAHDVHPAEVGERRDDVGGGAADERRAGSRPVVRSIRSASRVGPCGGGSVRSLIGPSEPPVLGRDVQHGAGEDDVGVARAGAGGGRDMAASRPGSVMSGMTLRR